MEPWWPLARSSSDRAVRVQAVAGDINLIYLVRVTLTAKLTNLWPSFPDEVEFGVLCSFPRHFTLTVPLSIQVYNWVLANLMLEVTLQWTSIPSCHRFKTGISSDLVSLNFSRLLLSLGLGRPNERKRRLKFRLRPGGPLRY